MVPDDAWLSSLDAHLTAAPEMPSVQAREEEDAREQKWAYFEMDCREFAASEPDGFAAVLRAVARAMKDQRDLLP